MILNDSILKNDEKAIYSLRELYRPYGYSRYKMSKFEEYDLYGKNKDFLVSDSVITFTDTNGKLMALKPDVTLSIVKNAKLTPGCVQKFYYNENVYRVSRSTHAFEEIMQAGLECIGDLDRYQLAEVLLLAVRSLATISDNFVLDLSHMGIVTVLIDTLSVSEEVQASLITCLGEKNLHGIRAICDRNGVSEEGAGKLIRLAETYGTLTEVLPKLEALCAGLSTDGALDDLRAIGAVLSDNGYGEQIRLDFSVINDMNYYSGVVFQGFVDGIPTGILSGGQYDKLMRKMGKMCGAVGFAVYLDTLERLHRGRKDYDADVLLLYSADADPVALTAEVRRLTADGKSVLAERTIPEKTRFGQILRWNNKNSEEIRND